MKRLLNTAGVQLSLKLWNLDVDGRPCMSACSHVVDSVVVYRVRHSRVGGHLKIVTGAKPIPTQQ